MTRSFRSAAAAGLPAVAAVAFSAACAQAPAPQVPGPRGAALAFTVDSVLHTPPLDRTHWGIAVVDRQSGATIMARNADHHFVPASNTKLVVAVVALGELGPDWRYETPVLVAAAPGDSVATGLLIAGRGDPTWSERFHDTRLAALDTIAALVIAAGIRRIDGDLVIDATYFDDAQVHGTWEVGDLPLAFAPPIDALAIDEGWFRITLEPGSIPGEPARAVPLGGREWQPMAATLRTDTAGARAVRELDALSRRDTIRFTGAVPIGTADTLTLAVTAPADYAGHALRDVLDAHGVTVTGRVRVVRDSVEAARLRGSLHGPGPGSSSTMYREIGRVRSPPLIDIVAAILRPSQNWIAEQLLKTLGAELRGAGTWETGIDVERRYLIDRAGIDSSSFVLRDASGLSVQNLLTPETTVRLLEHARSQTWGEAFRLALPAPGMESSTLETRLPELEHRLRAKTGTITHVNTLSGFLITDDGRELTFSIMTNASGRPSAAVRRGMDRLVRALANGGNHEP
ncbi:MAG: D-alanyl-D-alanine carboxypeptidase/D-alanyl-D-alanine-endopeptidase [Gemmatimonadetes bacterium]|nr:D-alanyl-D-alanine carboxypeptidase/D-alanyl-D-alanine-endopeptidase [Gemmatimonadota bacterium]